MASASTQTPKPHLATFADLLRIPEDRRRHEILDGEIIEKALPRWEHGVGQTRAGELLRRFNRKPNGPTRPGGWWILTEPTIQLSRHELVQPDLAGWRRDRVHDEPPSYPITLRPDWVCEIMSDGDARRRDGLQKRRIYADHDVPFYWLIDTERETLTVLSLTEECYVEQLTACRTDRVRAAPFDALELQIG
ncbi:MAG TPA: Uma2 family endonuclease, partial [Pseudomonadota bacterium]|nr:Uma2 family endonuclease [Pseudomonadota bacterium]